MANKPTQPVFPLGLAAEKQSTLAGVLNTGTIEHGPDAVLTLPEGNASAGLPSSVRYNADSDEFEGFYENGGWLPLGGGGIRWEVLPHASTATLESGRGYLINNTSGASTVVLPLPTRIGDSVTVCDMYGKFSVYPLTIDPNGKAMYGNVEAMTISTDSATATFTWTGDARGWIITAGVGLGQGRVYSRTIYTDTLGFPTSEVTLTTKPSIVDVYVDGKRLVESKYSLSGYEVRFSPSLPAGVELQVVQYVPIQLGLGSGGSDSGITPWVYNGGAAVGGETTISVPDLALGVPFITINGYANYPGFAYSYDSGAHVLTFSTPLETGDMVVLMLSGEVAGNIPVNTSAGFLAIEALRRTYADAGYNLVEGGFGRGGTVNTATDVLLNEVDGKAYSWGGTLPKTVPLGSTPATTGGIGDSAWVDRSSELLVKQVEVTAESFGVISGLVSQAVAKRNADKIMAKAAELSAAGGAKIIFTKPLYQVHLDAADYDPAPATIRVAALKIPYDNIILVGQGWTSTTIQAYDTRAAYSVIQWSASPLENGVSKVTGVGLHHICIDGNYHGDYTAASYDRQTAGVVGAGIIGLNISYLKIKNCSHYGLGLQNGGYKNCSINGLWVENVGADGMDIKDNMSNSRAFHINNVIVSNFGQLDEPANPWAGVDVMSLAPKISNVYVSDFGDKGQPNNGIRIKQGLINDELGRGTGGVWADITNITVVQNKSKAGTPSGSVGLSIRSPYVNYSNIVCMGVDGATLGTGIWIEERYCNGSNVQISKADVGYTTTGASGASERVYGDSQACSVTGITIVDTARALVLNTKFQKVVNAVLKNCPIGVVVGGSIAGKVTIRGIHLDGVTDPFGQMGATYHNITDVTGPDAVNWQASVGIIKGASDFAATTITCKNSVRLYANTTDTAIGTELARFAPTLSNIYSPLSVTGNIMPATANTGYIGSSASSWAGGFTQTAFTVTSDENYKTVPVDMTDEILDAWSEVDFVQYQYLDRVEEKGVDGARWHFGVIAQRTKEAFERHGLDAHRFGFLCYDEWDDKPEVIDEMTGDVRIPAIPAGSRYGIRYEEALVMEAALQRRNYQRLLNRIEALENK